MTLTKLIELQDAATPGPWTLEIEDLDEVSDVAIPEINRLIHGDFADPCDFERDVKNGQFITAARNFDFAALDAKIKRYEDALRFYASGEHFRFGHYSVGFGDTFYTTERGERARKALEGTE